jgi:hypothetical protein
MLIFMQRGSLACWHGRLEKLADHRKQPIGALHQRNVRRAWQHGQL